MSTEEVSRDCGSGRQCGYAVFSGDVGCTDGGNYFWAEMLSAKESNFHDAALVKATGEINSILSSLSKDAGERRLSFLQTPLGIMLAWVRHDLKIPEDAVTAESPAGDIIVALGLIREPTAD